MKKTYIYIGIVVLGVLLETAMVSFLKGQPNIYTSAILWMIGGLLTAVGAIPLLVFPKNEQPNASIKISNQLIFKILGIFLVLSVMFAGFVSEIFAKHPSNPLEADVIPTIEILVRRLLKGEWVYAPIDFPGWTVNNAYLPMQYFPFVLAEKTHMDYRWLSYIAFIVVIFFWLKNMLQNGQTEKEIIFKIAFLFIALFALRKHDAGSFAFSLELIDVAFYLFLGLSFFIQDWRIKVIALLCCLLSRYAFVFWLPFYAISYWLQYGQKDALRILKWTVIGVVILYVIPFMSFQPTLFFDGLKYYDKTAIGQWTDIPEWYKHVGKPFHLTQGLSTSIYFYDFWQGDILAKLGAARMTQTLLTLLSVVIISLCFWRWNKKENFDYQGFMLVSLKFYFIFFYGFFYVPFSYLYWIPLFYGMIILFKIPFSRNNS